MANSSHAAPILSLNAVDAGYGQITALKSISLKIFPGEIVTIIGANGAGKTTLLRTISRLHELRSGTISFETSPISQTSAHELLVMGLAHVPEGRKIFPRLTVLENLELGAYCQKNKTVIDQEMEHVFSLFPILKERRSQLGGTLSGGEQQMLAISRALMSRPKMLLLDEPSMGVAPILVSKIFERIVELNRNGLTILLVEQNAHLALKVASRGYVLENGAIVLQDLSSNLLSNSRVKEAYLG